MKVLPLFALVLLVSIPASADTLTTTNQVTFAHGVPWNTVPRPVQEGFQRFGGTATLVNVEQGTIGGQKIYTATFSQNGQPVNLTLTENGIPYGARTQLTWNDIPLQTQQAFLTLFNLDAITAINQHEIAGAPIYDFTINSLGQRSHLQIDQNGTILTYLEEPPTGVGTTNLTWDQVPLSVQNTIAAQTDAGQVEQMKRTLLNGQIIYDVIMNNGLQQKEVRIASNGTVLGSSTIMTEAAGAATPMQQLRFEELPAAAQGTVRALAGAEAISNVRPVALNGRLCYEVSFEKDGEVLQIFVSETGEIFR